MKHVTFYDDDVRFWQAWMSRSAAGELSITAGNQQPPIGGGHMTIKGRHFLVVCCENKVTFLDLVSVRLVMSRGPYSTASLPFGNVLDTKCIFIRICLA